MIRKLLLAILILGGGFAGVVAFSPELRASLSPSASRPELEGSILGGDLILADVSSKPFEAMIQVQGYLDSQSNATLSSQVERTTTILSIVPEGTWVKEGQVVCELDSSELEEKLKQQQIDVTQAEAKLSQASEELAIQRTQNESDIAAAKLNAELAKLDREKYEDGEYPAKEKELSGKVAIELEEYRRAEESYEFTKRLVRKGYETPSDLESKRIAMKREELELQRSREDLKVLTRYTKKRELAELQANVEEYERELERVRLKAKSAEAQAVAEVDSAKLTLEVENEKLVRYRNQLAACTIRAPQAGEVVYANLQQSRRGSDGNTIEEGAQVRERQAIINLPDVTKMKVSCRIHESLISQIHSGLPAAIRVDAYPDQVFNGEIASVSSVPMSGSWPNMDLREYQTEIVLTDPVQKVRQLRPGLTTQVEIFIDRRDEVLQVPQQAVVKANRETLVFVADSDGRVERRLIELGMTNSTTAEVLDGLNSGDRVVLNPRTRFAEQIAEVERLDREAASEEFEAMPASTSGRTTQPVAANASEERGEKGKAGRKKKREGKSGKGPGDAARSGSPAEGFKRLDKDGNGRISAAEAPFFKDRIATADTDGDGELSLDEFKMLSRNSSRPGMPNS